MGWRGVLVRTDIPILLGLGSKYIPYEIEINIDELVIHDIIKLEYMQI